MNWFGQVSRSELLRALCVPNSNHFTQCPRKQFEQKTELFVHSGWDKTEVHMFYLYLLILFAANL